MKIKDEKRKGLLKDYCKAEILLKELKKIVENEIELTDDDMYNHFSKSQDLSDLIMDLYNEVNDVYCKE